MSGNLENDRAVNTGKMYPIDLAPQKITIVKSVSNTEVKMAHLITGQPKTTAAGQIITHTGSVGLMRPATQILSTNVSSQPQMIVSSSPILQGSQIVSQGPQIIGQNTQIISQSQLINTGGQIISPGTQIISQGTQLSAVSSGNTSQVSVASTVAGAQVLSVGGIVAGNQGQLMTGAGNLVVSSSVRTLPPSVRVLPPLPHHNSRPALLSSVSVASTGVLVSKGVTSHVPRGLAAGASLAVRPVTPAAAVQTVGSHGAWSGSGRGRGALVYGARAPLARAVPPRAPSAPPVIPSLASTPAQPSLPSAPQTPLSAIVTLSTTTVLTSSSVISSSIRGVAPRAVTPAPAAPRPLPLLQRNYHSAKVLGVSSVGVRGVVGNSAPAQLYYEVPRAPVTDAPATHTPQVNVVNAIQSMADVRASPAVAVAATAMQPRPTILRKRELDGSPSKPVILPYRAEVTGWEDVATGARHDGSGGSTTMSASSSPAHLEEPDVPAVEREDVSPRKKPRKQMLSNEIRQCQEYQSEEAPPTPPTVEPKPPPKRPQLSSSYVCGWRSTALHFTRPADVRRRDPRAKDILAIAGQKHVLNSAEGWKVHHLTAQMEDLVSLEDDVGSQLADRLRSLEGAGIRAFKAIEPQTHILFELLKGNIQRSKIVCEGIQEAREDILRVFTHRNFVSDILTRQADKRCFRKHRSQS